MILRQQKPENLESDFSCLKAVHTPNTEFYVRSHFDVPRLDGSWRLRLEGAVRRPLKLSLEELQQMEPQTVPATLECAGNGRVYLVPKQQGVQWQMGAVGHADWTGVSLAALLQKAEVSPSAREVLLVGADQGTPEEKPKPGEPIRFARSLPLEQALRPEVTLAYRMNREALTPSHGYPLRCIVPGWYAVASVKWLQRIVVLEEPFLGYFQTTDYATWRQSDGLATRVPLTQLQVKSQIARPSLGEEVPAGADYRVQGAAWSSVEVVKVEVSDDGGRSWCEAQLSRQTRPHSWQLWEWSWSVPAKPGDCTLMSRATDASGAVQPQERDRSLEGYAIHHVLEVPVKVQ